MMTTGSPKRVRMPAYLSSRRPSHEHRHRAKEVSTPIRSGLTPRGQASPSPPASLRGTVLGRPWVVGELALGNRSPVSEVPRLPQELPAAAVASHQEVSTVFGHEGLAGLGIGYVAAQLLAATRLTPDTRLWIGAMRFAATAVRWNVGFEPEAGGAARGASPASSYGPCFFPGFKTGRGVAGRAQQGQLGECDDRLRGSLIGSYYLAVQLRPGLVHPGVGPRVDTIHRSM